MAPWPASAAVSRVWRCSAGALRDGGRQRRLWARQGELRQGSAEPLCRRRRRAPAPAASGGRRGGRARAREPLGAGAAAGSRCLAPSPSPPAGKGRRGGEPLLPRGGPTASGAAVGQSTCFQLQRLGGGRGEGGGGAQSAGIAAAALETDRSGRRGTAPPRVGSKGPSPEVGNGGSGSLLWASFGAPPVKVAAFRGGGAIPAGAGREAATFPTSSFPDLQAQALEEPPSQSSGSSAGSLARLPSAALTPPCPALEPYRHPSRLQGNKGEGALQLTSFSWWQKRRLSSSDGARSPADLPARGSACQEQPSSPPAHGLVSCGEMQLLAQFTGGRGDLLCAGYYPRGGRS